MTRIVYLQTSVTFCYFYVIEHFVLGRSERSHLAVITAVCLLLKVTEVAKSSGFSVFLQPQWSYYVVGFYHFSSG